MNKNKNTAWFILGALFVYMWLLNALMPLHRDDYEYSLIWNTTQHITSFKDIITSLQIHYLQHGGRMPSFFFQENFLLWGKEYYNPVAAMLYVFINLLIYWHARHKLTLKISPVVLLTVLVFTWFGLPDWGVTAVWMNGSCVYMLSAVYIFAMLLPYNIEIFGSASIGDSWLKLVSFFVLGVISGWGVENTSFSMLLLILGACIKAYREKKLRYWMVSGLVGSLSGYALLFFAPGNFARVRYMNHAGVGQRILNQLVGSADMILGLLFAIGFAMLAWRLLLKEYAHKHNIQIPEGYKYPKPGCGCGDGVKIAIICLLVFSKMMGTGLYEWISSLIFLKIITPLGMVRGGNAQLNIVRALVTIEDLVLYLLVLVQVYKYSFKHLDILKRTVRPWATIVRYKNMLAEYPQLNFAVLMLKITVLNQLIMLGAPSFPGRASYGSAIFFIIGVVSLWNIAPVQALLKIDLYRRFVYKVSFMLLVPMMIVVAWQYYGNYTEDQIRMQHAAQMSKQGEKILEIPALTIRNEVLRHVYFVDFPNRVTVGGFKRYFGFEEVRVTKP